MDRIEYLHGQLEQYHLLKHPFYQDWNEGKLSLATLRKYAQQYHHHVDTFPRYISRIHSKCDDLKSRQVLLGNLMEEEHGPENHPELWLRFAESLGVDRADVRNSAMLENTRKLVDGYYGLAEASYPKGLGSLYGYERQVPEIAQSKIEGLKKFYGINSERGLKFFVVHITADEWHSQECLDLVRALPPAEQEEACQGAIEGARLLWQFLDGVHAECR